jgi:hypothetical protein
MLPNSRQSRIDRHQHKAGTSAGEIGLEVTMAVPIHDGHAVSALQPTGSQRRGQAMNTLRSSQ